LEAAAASPFDELVRIKASPGAEDSAAQDWLEKTVPVLRNALLGYGLQAKIISSRLTPNAALVRIKGTDRMGVEDIETRQSALLTTHGLRIISVSARPGEVVVAVERPTREIVSLWDVWARRKLNRGPSGLNLSFVVGIKELDGELLYLNLGGAFAGLQHHEPHTLIAGTTGSGKSVLLQNLLLDIAATNSSSLAKIFLVDPKMGVDYSAIEALPHIQNGIISSQEDALSVLSDMVAEMDRRYETFKGIGRDLRAFIEKAAAAKRLPVIFVVHDEFADWMMIDEYREAVTSLVGRLGAKARGAGIHLIFAAQRPEASVMPMQLRSNLGNRLVLRVSDVGTSEIALGSKGAERLLGKGHLAARLAGESDTLFAQVPFLGDDEVTAAVVAIRSNDPH
jgi:S-DNA-T family DNA segregation ATPase FtsK/SpoIIIE